jgi:lysozyme family protein
MKKNWPKSQDLVFGDEGGYVNRKTDKGGPTNMGITLARLSEYRGYKCTIQDLQNLTKKEASDIYKSGYWDAIRADELPSGLDYAVFDFYVNSGAWGVKILQRTLGVQEDGVIGIQTMKAIENYPSGVRGLIKDYIDQRMKYLRSLGGKQGFGPNGRGWTIRVTGVDPKGQWAKQPGVIGNALAMVSDDTASKPIPTELPPAIDPAPKALNENRSVTSILAKPEAVTGYVTTVAGIFTAVSGNTVLSYALGIVIVLGAAAFIYQKLQSVRKA